MEPLKAWPQQREAAGLRNRITSLPCQRSLDIVMYSSAILLSTLTIQVRNLWGILFRYILQKLLEKNENKPKMRPGIPSLKLFSLHPAFTALSMRAFYFYLIKCLHPGSSLVVRDEWKELAKLFEQLNYSFSSYSTFLFCALIICTVLFSAKTKLFFWCFELRVDPMKSAFEAFA